MAAFFFPVRIRGVAGRQISFEYQRVIVSQIVPPPRNLKGFTWLPGLFYLPYILFFSLLHPNRARCAIFLSGNTHVLRNRGTEAGSVNLGGIHASKRPNRLRYTDKKAQRRRRALSFLSCTDLVRLRPSCLLHLRRCCTRACCGNEGGSSSLVSSSPASCFCCEIRCLEIQTRRRMHRHQRQDQV